MTAVIGAGVVSDLGSSASETRPATAARSSSLRLMPRSRCSAASSRAGRSPTPNATSHAAPHRSSRPASFATITAIAKSPGRRETSMIAVPSGIVASGSDTEVSSS